MTSLRPSLKMTYIALWIMLGLTAIATLLYGDLPWNVVWQGITQRWLLGATQWNALLDERLPRLIVLFCTGASLAVSGAVMQALFHNPLASPSVLGVSCGGSLCVLLVFILGWHSNYPYAIPIAAFGGCLITILFIYTLSQRRSGAPLHNLILTGIAISTLLLAIQGAILYALRDQWQLIQTLTEWESGSTSNRTWKHVHMQLPLTLVGLIGCWWYRREIDLLALGDEEACNLGVNVNQVRWRLFLCVAILTGGALAAVGMIAFFGLVLPHMMRRLQGPSNVHLIPLCLMGGGTAIAILDLGLRMLHIYTLSIGNVAAILGGLFFLFLLFKREPEHLRQAA
ncbi:MAG: iron ABC transporter permease [Parachlamydiaceae bacterium]|nr:iron ABC transporter permease [Parachlamydiaceae bacterium]